MPSLRELGLHAPLLLQHLLLAVESCDFAQQSEGIRRAAVGVSLSVSSRLSLSVSLSLSLPCVSLSPSGLHLFSVSFCLFFPASPSLPISLCLPLSLFVSLCLSIIRCLHRLLLQQQPGSSSCLVCALLHALLLLQLLFAADFVLQPIGGPLVAALQRQLVCRLAESFAAIRVSFLEATTRLETNGLSPRAAAAAAATFATSWLMDVLLLLLLLVCLCSVAADHHRVYRHWRAAIWLRSNDPGAALPAATAANAAAAAAAAAL